MSEQESLRILVADDDPLARRVIKAALRDAGMIVVAEARDGREAVELGVYYRPDVIVTDVVMPRLDGILATRRILKEVPDQIVVVLSGIGENEVGLLALQAGAAGFISKDVDVDTLPRTLRAVHTGEAAISRAMTRRVIDAFRSAARDAPACGPSTVHSLPASGRSSSSSGQDTRPITSLTSSCSPPKPCAPTSRTSCASSASTHARTPSPPPSGSELLLPRPSVSDASALLEHESMKEGFPTPCAHSELRCRSGTLPQPVAGVDTKAAVGTTGLGSNSTAAVDRCVPPDPDRRVGERGHPWPRGVVLPCTRDL